MGIGKLEVGRVTVPEVSRSELLDMVNNRLLNQAKAHNITLTCSKHLSGDWERSRFYNKASREDALVTDISDAWRLGCSHLEERGKTYDYLIWKEPCDNWWPQYNYLSPEKDIIPFFKGRGYSGNVVAYLALIAAGGPLLASTVPEVSPMACQRPMFPRVYRSHQGGMICQIAGEPGYHDRTFKTPSLHEYTLDFCSEAPRSLSYVGFREVDKRAQAPSDLPPDHYRIKVVSTASPTFTDLESAYDTVSGAWNERTHAPKISPHLGYARLTTGDKIVYLQKFDAGLSNDALIRWGFANGFRPAFPVEREAFSSTYPALQREFDIVDLGSSTLLHERFECVPVLTMDMDEGRHLGFHQNLQRPWKRPTYHLFVRC